MSNLHEAKKNKNDEFYTQLPDIERELKHYDLSGKIIYCNCDTEESHFVKYFTKQLKAGKIKKLLKSSADFRSEESIAKLKEADVVVTNPPFSLFREYIAQLIEHDKKFLVIGNQNAITYKETFKLIKESKIWLGAKNNLSMVYKSPYKNILEANRKYVAAKGFDPDKYIKVPAVNWYTNIEHNKRHEDLILYKEFNEEDYPRYDNYDAINVDKIKDIPCDYFGVMGVPITFLDHHNPDQFEIIGFMASTKITKFNFGYPYIDKKKKYARILVRRIR
jgi:hypothetical protein